MRSLRLFAAPRTADTLPFRSWSRRDRVPFIVISLVTGFFAVLLVCLALSASRLVLAWDGERSETATLQILGDPALIEAHSRAALEILRDTPGVTGVRMIDIEEQRDLLEPWLGPDVPFDSLPLPLLMEVGTDRSVLDVESLRARLDQAAPGSVLDDHRSTWIPLIRNAERLLVFSGVALVLLAAIFLAGLDLAVRLRAAQAQGDVAVLHRLGARDGQLVRGLGQGVLRTAAAAVIAGTILAVLLLLMLPAGSEQGFFLVGIAPEGWHWLVALAVPPAAVLLAWAGTA